MATSTSLSHFLKSSAIFTISGVLVNLLGYAFHIFAGRYLGPGSYSEITTVFAYVMLLSVPIMVVNFVIVSQSGSYSHGPARAAFLSSLRNYFDTLARSYSLLAGLYSGLALLGYLNHLSIATALVMPAFVLTLIYAQLYPILLQSAKRFIPLSFILLTAGFLKLAAALTALWLPSAPLILFLLALANLIQVWLARRYLPAAPINVTPFSPAQIIADPRLKLIFLSLLGIIALNNLDVVIAKQVLPAGMAGMYGVWSLFAKAITYSFLPLSSVALVFFTDRESIHHSSRILFYSIIFLSATGITAYFAFRLLAELLVTKLMGPAFSPLSSLLPTAAVFGTLYSMIYLINNYYLSVNSKLALLPTIVVPISMLVILFTNHSLSSFTATITLCGGLALLTYLLSILWRTTRTSVSPSH
ncbi:MAG: hypothetical protein ABII21_02020 [bacterium]